MKIVVLDGYAANPGDISWDGLRQLGDVTIYPRSKADEVVERAKDADILLTNKVNMTDEVMAQLPRLKYIGVLATGFNIIDTEAAHRRGIVVTNIPAYSTESVVQMTFAHILNITNRVGHYSHQNRRLRWSHNADFCYWDAPLPELDGKTLGIVGLGHIGRRVAEIALAFHLKVIALSSKPQEQLPAGIRKVTIDELLHEADIVTLHCPLTKDNQHFFNAARLAQMKEGAMLINTARGALVDEADVAAALASGHLGGYGADVMEEEPPRDDNPLLAQPHAWLTPHIAWASRDARQRLMQICVANVKSFIEGKPQNEV